MSTRPCDAAEKIVKQIDNVYIEYNKQIKLDVHLKGANKVGKYNELS